jgi:enamine deaminase RidA (YjgF/YER057c/UK114 family)
MTDPDFSKTNHNHNAGWSKDLFTDVVVVHGNARTLYFAGVCSEDPDAVDLPSVRILGDGDFGEQTRVVFRKIQAMLAAHGATMHDIVRMVTYVTDAGNMREFFRIQGEALGDAPRPPHTFIPVAALAVPEMLVEVEITAVVAA